MHVFSLFYDYCVYMSLSDQSDACYYRALAASVWQHLGLPPCPSDTDTPTGRCFLWPAITTDGKKWSAWRGHAVFDSTNKLLCHKLDQRWPKTVIWGRSHTLYRFYLETSQGLASTHSGFHVFVLQQLQTADQGLRRRTYKVSCLLWVLVRGCCTLYIAFCFILC